MVKIQHFHLPQYQQRRRIHNNTRHKNLFAFAYVGIIIIVFVVLSKQKDDKTVSLNGSNVNNALFFGRQQLPLSVTSVQDPRRQALAKDINISLSCYGSKEDVGMKSNARDLFCLAATGSYVNDQEKSEKRIQCDAVHSSRNAILDVWANVRSKISLETIIDVTTHATEWPFTIQTNFTSEANNSKAHSQTLFVWSTSDEPVKMWQSKLELGSYDRHFADLKTSTNGKTRNNNAKKKKNVTNEKPFVWVDVGSELGLVPLTMAWQRHETLKKILSIEAAPPNWLLQQLNFACNPPHDNLSQISHHYIDSILTGAWSPNEIHDSVGRVYWRKSDSATLPSWLYDPSNDVSEESDNQQITENENILPFVIPTTTFQNLMQKVYYNPQQHGGDVSNNKNSQIILHLNCKGCEYNLLSRMSEQDLNDFNIKHILGNLNWPSLRRSLKPPLYRATITRELACRYRAIASANKECCAVSEMPIVDYETSTVGLELGSICLTEFDSWAEQNDFWTIKQEHDEEILWAQATTL